MKTGNPQVQEKRHKENQSSPTGRDLHGRALWPQMEGDWPKRNGRSSSRVTRNLRICRFIHSPGGLLIPS